MSTSLMNLPGVQTVDLAQYGQELDFIPRVQLISSQSKYVSMEKIAPGHYGVPGSNDEIEDLGKSIDILPICARDKALDTSADPPLAVYDASDDVFQGIKKRAGTKDSGCMYGPSFLVFERNTGRFFELFLGNKSGRTEAPRLAPFLPVNEAQAKANKVKPKAPTPCTLSAKLIKRPGQAWHAPVVTKCSTPINNLPVEKAIDEANKFLNPKKANAEVASDQRAR